MTKEVLLCVICLAIVANGARIACINPSFTDTSQIDPRASVDRSLFGIEISFPLTVFGKSWRVLEDKLLTNGCADVILLGLTDREVSLSRTEVDSSQKELFYDKLRVEAKCNRLAFDGDSVVVELFFVPGFLLVYAKHIFMIKFLVSFIFSDRRNVYLLGVFLSLLFCVMVYFKNTTPKNKDE